MTSLPSSSAEQFEARATGFRRYLAFRIACVVAAALALAAVVCALVFKESQAGFISSLAAFVALFITFQVLMHKRRAHFRSWLVLKNEV